MLNRAQELERRSHPRAETLGKALVIIDDETAVTYRVENLSAGGALLSGGEVLPLWNIYRLVLRLDGLPALEIKARAVWKGEGTRPRFGVSFEHLDETVQDLINDVVLGILSGEDNDAPPVSGDKLVSWLP